MVANTALILWPIVVIVLFRRLPPSSAILWSILGGYLLLPTRIEFDFPLVPPLDKHSIPVLMAAFMAWHVSRTPNLSHRGQDAKTDGVWSVRPGWIPEHPIARGLLVLLFVGVIGTTVTNMQPLVYGRTVLPGASAQVAASMMLHTAILILPLLLARKFLAHPDQHRMILFALLIAGLAYSVPALFEIRMSPQLNVWIYGFFPHSFAQHFRAGGFRPVVFLQHGLELAIFLAMCATAALGYAKASTGRQRSFAFAATGVIFLTLVLSKTLGAFLIGFFCLAAVFFLGPRRQILFAFCIAVAVVGYPSLRNAGFVPVDKALTLVENYSNSSRAGSLRTRFFHEERLLQHAREKPFFGWGQDGRSRVFDAAGNDITISDGYWAILMGVGGWARYLGVFGLLTLPIAVLWWRQRSELTIVTSTLAIVLGANLFDLIPNSSFYPLTMLLGGALLGTLEVQRAGAEAKPSDGDRSETPVRIAKGPRPAGPVYTRQTQTRARREASHSRFPAQPTKRDG